MLGVGFSFVGIFVLVYMLIKKVNAHMALLLSGLFLLSLAGIFGFLAWAILRLLSAKAR